ncbi:MAG: extracellular solute-binding protein family 1, partial [Thermomicrobiales bacterium]|nr:extracellular solute-binding protein family 1 [Thermomicrobiales bacterium]
EDMQAFFAENPNFRTAVEQLPMTQPQDSARVFIPNGDQIIGAGLERIVINHEEPQPVFDEVAATLTEEAQPVLEAIAALAG